MNFRKIFAPKSNELREIKVVATWLVRWHSRHNAYSSGTTPEVEVFTSRESAEEFAHSLRAAFRLLRHTSGTEITVTRK